MQWHRVVVVVVVVVSGPACVDVPPLPGSVVVCVGADDCPDGLVCDLEVHECRAEGQAAPAVVDVVVEPAVTRGGSVAVVIRADVALDPTVAPVIEFAAGSTALPLTFAGVEGAEARMSVVVDDDVPEGVYELAAVDVVSASGVRGRRALTGTSLRVDRTAPLVFGVELVAPPADRTYANDVAGVDVVTVRFSANEPVDLERSRLTVGTLSSPPGGCTAGDALDVVCALAIPAGAPDGPFTPAVVVLDPAGNEASVAAGDAIQVDTAAPGLVEDSVRLLITTAGRPAEAASPASVVSVSFIVSEPVVRAPVVTLVDAGVALALRSRQGQSFTYELVTGLALPDQPHPISALLEDRFGHATAVTVVDDVPFSSGAGACPPAAGTTCVDVDGDGHAQRDPLACPDGADDDDLDATVSPDVLELPGDGKDNDQIGGDLPLDDVSGVFVDADGGLDSGDGTRANPVQSLTRAVALIGARQFLFLATSTTPYRFTSSGRVRVSLVGGLDRAQDWARTPAHSVVDAELNDADEPVVYDSIDGIAGAGTVGAVFELVRCRLSSLAAGEPDVSGGSRLIVIDSAVSGVLAFDSSLDAVGSQLGEVGLFRSTAGRVSRSEVIGAVQLDDGGALIGVNSFFGGGVGGLTLGFGTSVALFHSTVRNDAGPAIDFSQSDSDNNVVAVASVFVSGTNGAVIALVDTSTTLVGCNISNTGGALMRVSRGFNQTVVAVADVVAVNACGFAGCARAEGNRSEAPGFATVFHLAPSSALVDDGVVATAFGAPFAVAADFDGDCRYVDGAADLGADEVP
ncbi:MAG: hypothetical protein Q8O67_09140 [Deltaproteobacteria bacterium]|nr:hypothetical protein [Deltaproteobacteria bacterium]